jgi:hypothetical protein
MTPPTKSAEHEKLAAAAHKRVQDASTSGEQQAQQHEAVYQATLAVLYELRAAKETAKRAPKKRAAPKTRAPKAGATKDARGPDHLPVKS